ncbi:MAG: lactonase family protein [Verrucomicrobiales bacterium]|nr:lactonase family protein [Verrucomicrobiales bacterium]
MKPFTRIFATLFSVMTASPIAKGDDPLVFISAFTSGEKGAIHACTFDSELGALTPVDRSTDVENPFFMTLSRDGNFLYAIHALKFGGEEDEEVAAYRVEGRSGKLSLLNRQSSKGTASCYLDIDATGKAVVVANYSSGNVASYAIADDGKLSEPVSYFKHTGSSVDPKRQTGPNAHSIVISPDNRYAFAADLGIDKVMIYRLDAETATLTPNDPPFVKLPPGSGPRHITFHPNGKHLYVINEMGNTVSVFGYNSETGALTDQQIISTLPEGYEERTHTADLKITPDGKFLYGSNRGHDTIAGYRIGDDGNLTSIGFYPSLGKGPQNLAIMPDGRHLLCANMPGNSVVVFEINPETGALSAVGDSIEIPMPACIAIKP